jgi:hypothetical protein
VADDALFDGTNADRLMSLGEALANPQGFVESMVETTIRSTDPALCACGYSGTWGQVIDHASRWQRLEPRVGHRALLEPTDAEWELAGACRACGVKGGYHVIGCPRQGGLVG